MFFSKNPAASSAEKAHKKCEVLIIKIAESVSDKVEVPEGYFPIKAFEMDTGEILLPQNPHEGGSATMESHPYGRADGKWQGYDNYNQTHGFTYANRTLVLKGSRFCPQTICDIGGFHPYCCVSDIPSDPSLDIDTHQDEYDEDRGNAKQSTAVVSYTTKVGIAKQFAFYDILITRGNMEKYSAASALFEKNENGFFGWVYGIVSHGGIRRKNLDDAAFASEREISIPGGTDWANVVIARKVFFNSLSGEIRFVGDIYVIDNPLTFNLSPEEFRKICSCFMTKNWPRTETALLPKNLHLAKTVAFDEVFPCSEALATKNSAATIDTQLSTTTTTTSNATETATTTSTHSAGETSTSQPSAPPTSAVQSNTLTPQLNHDHDYVNFDEDDNVSLLEKLTQKCACSSCVLL